MAPNNTSSSGSATPESTIDSVLSVHPTAARRDASIVVQSDKTAYSDEFITSTYVNRGAEVNVVNGQYLVKPTADEFRFQTKRAVGKTG